MLRVNQPNSRVNGCIIGSADKGCLATDPPRPLFSLYDRRQTQLFDGTDDPSLFFNRSLGAGMKASLPTSRTAPIGIDTIECDPSDPNCPRVGATP
jgi:hypothetical protein